MISLFHVVSCVIVYVNVICCSCIISKWLLFQGAKLADVVARFDWLKQQIMDRGRDLGFSGRSSEVIAHAQQMLGDNLIKRTVIKNTAKSL